MPSRSTLNKYFPNQERLSQIALGFVLVIALIFVFSSVSWAQSVPKTEAKTNQQPFSTLPENMRLRIMLKMIKVGKQDEAERLLQAHPLTGRHSQNRTLFLEGLIAKVRKRYKIATKKFRAALANDPKLTMVRAELAHTLFITKQDDGAKHHLKLLSGAAPTPDLAKQFDRFIDAVDARRPWKMSAYVAMAPTTNFTNGTTRRLAPGGGIIAGNSREKSGIGVTGGANASYTFRPGNDLSVVTAAGVNFREYSGKAFDDLIISQDVSLVRKHKEGKIAIGVSTSQRRAGVDEFILEGGPYIAITQKISNKTQFYAKLRHLRTDFKQADYRNGGTTTLDTRLSNTIAPATIFFLVSGGQRTTTKLKHLDFWAAYGGIGLYKEFPFGITVYSEGKLTRKHFDGDFFGLTEPQMDTKIDFVASFTKRDFDIFGLAPRLDYIYSKSVSNSIFSQYSTHGANLTMTKAF